MRIPGNGVNDVGGVLSPEFVYFLIGVHICDNGVVLPAAAPQKAIVAVPFNFKDCLVSVMTVMNVNAIEIWVL